MITDEFVADVDEYLETATAEADQNLALGFAGCVANALKAGAHGGSGEAMQLELLAAEDVKNRAQALKHQFIELLRVNKVELDNTSFASAFQIFETRLDRLLPYVTSLLQKCPRFASNAAFGRPATMVFPTFNERSQNAIASEKHKARVSLRGLVNKVDNIAPQQIHTGHIFNGPVGANVHGNNNVVNVTQIIDAEAREQLRPALSTLIDQLSGLIPTGKTEERVIGKAIAEATEAMTQLQNDVVDAPRLASILTALGATVAFLADAPDAFQTVIGIGRSIGLPI